MTQSTNPTQSVEQQQRRIPTSSEIGSRHDGEMSRMSVEVVVEKLFSHSTF